MSTTSDSIIFDNIIRIGCLEVREYVRVCELLLTFELTQMAAGVKSSLSKLELVCTNTAKLPRITLPTSTPSSRKMAPPLKNSKLLITRRNLFKKMHSLHYERGVHSHV